MIGATVRLAELLPIRIERAELEDPTLMVGGTNWSLSATCVWRWVKADGSVLGEASRHVSDLVWDLIGESVVAVDWAGPASLGLDPTFVFESGGLLQLMSDASYDTWVLHIPDLVLVGPMPED